MILLLDSGNTRLKWATLDTGLFRPGNHAFCGNDDPAEIFEKHWGALNRPGRVVVSNVAGAGTEEALNVWAGRKWNLKPEYILSTSSACGVSNGYRNPDLLGSDRWAALIGAHHHIPLPVCIVDCGTAITIDVLDREGRHLGGLISPGLNMMMASLSCDTAGLNRFEFGPSDGIDVLAKGTQDCMQNGVLQSAVALIEQTHEHINTAYGLDAGLVLTGGDAMHILPRLHGTIRFEPDLVLKGLAVFAGDPACDM